MTGNYALQYLGYVVIHGSLSRTVCRAKQLQQGRGSLAVFDVNSIVAYYPKFCKIVQKIVN